MKIKYILEIGLKYYKCSLIYWVLEDFMNLSNISKHMAQLGCIMEYLKIATFLKFIFRLEFNLRQRLSAKHRFHVKSAGGNNKYD